MRPSGRGSRVGTAAATLLVQAEIDVFLKLAELLGEPAVLELELLDLAGHLAELVFQPRRADQQIGRILRRSRHNAASKRGGERQGGQSRTGEMAG